MHPVNSMALRHDDSTINIVVVIIIIIRQLVCVLVNIVDSGSFGVFKSSLKIFLFCQTFTLS